jgi:hypothetical protein
MAARGHREAARSVLDNIEHGGRLLAGRGEVREGLPAMKHASAETLLLVADLLAAIRTRNVLTEKKPGIFYRKGQAFLHFHEDKAGIFMDLRDGADWLRLPASGPGASAQCLEALDRATQAKPV